MTHKRLTRTAWWCSALLVAVAISVSIFSLAAAEQQGATGAPIIWRDPGAIETLDLFWGVGSPDRAPKPPFKFVEEVMTGTTAKVVVEDARGDLWDVKLNPEEAHPDVVANRLLWALGYLTQEMYFLHEGTITGGKNLRRAKDFLKNDRFVAARFRRRDPALTSGEGWAFDNNPFKGRQELSGLIILMALINNWDTADTTNKEVMTFKRGDGSTEQWYVAKDLGGSFGRFKGPQGTPIKWHLQAFQADPLIQRVEGDTLVLDYQAFGTPPTRVPLDHARWFADWVGRLSEVQISAALKAGGATPAETDGFTKKLMAKIAELRNAVGEPTK